MRDETVCEFVSSRGLLKSCDVHARTPISSCPTNLEYLDEFIESQHNKIIDSTANKPISIYVCGDALQKFIVDYAPKIKRPFIVVCGDGDKTMFRETVPTKPNMFVLFMLDPLLNGIYCQNMDINDCRDYLKDKIAKLWKANASVFRAENVPKTIEIVIQNTLSKLRQIPIGMDYHSIHRNPKHRWLAKGDTSITPLSQEELLIRSIRSSMTPFYARRIQIYSNVMLCVDRFKDRVTAVSRIPANLLFQQIKFIPRLDTWKNMTQFAFVLSPFGNGMDCHRTWEALLCGCIPIVRTNVFKELFEGLPVLIVDRWEDITPSLLKQTVYEFKLKHLNNLFQYEKLTLAYYTNWWKNN